MYQNRSVANGFMGGKYSSTVLSLGLSGTLYFRLAMIVPDREDGTRQQISCMRLQVMLLLSCRESGLFASARDTVFPQTHREPESEEEDLHIDRAGNDLKS
jgi:hypothetical protein